MCCKKQLSEMKIIFVAVFFVLPLTSWCYSWHSSIDEFESMLEEDLDLLESLNDAVIIQWASIKTFQTNLESIALEIQEHLNTDLDFRHPVTYFRFANVLEKIGNIQNLNRDNTADKLLVLLESYPNEKDYAAVLNHLMYLQSTYKLKAADLANGINGEYDQKYKIKHTMTVHDCLVMANMAEDKGEIELQLEWYQQALKTISKEDTSAYSEQSILSLIKATRDKVACKQLCRSGGDVVTNNRRLKCVLWNNYKDPWLILQPVKMEHLANSPNVVRFHDVILDEEIKMVKKSCWHKLQRANKISFDDTVTIKSIRIAHNCWLNESEHSIALRLSNRIQHITGLSMENAEPLQVANYGIGGHYLPHKDAGYEDGYDRTATFMFYLSDTQYGGATAFISPGIAVKPVKGSAVFWYNLLSSGDVDPRTTHCACDVILGNKWIANKWIHPTDNDICRKYD